MLLVDRGGLTPLGSHADARAGGGGSEPAEQPDGRGGSINCGVQRGCLQPDDDGIVGLTEVSDYL